MSDQPQDKAVPVEPGITALMDPAALEMRLVEARARRARALAARAQSGAAQPPEGARPAEDTQPPEDSSNPSRPILMRQITSRFAIPYPLRNFAAGLAIGLFAAVAIPAVLSRLAAEPPQPMPVAQAAPETRAATRPDLRLAGIVAQAPGRLPDWTVASAATAAAPRPEPRPADLRPVRPRQVSARNHPAPQPSLPALIGAVFADQLAPAGRKLQAKTDQGLREAAGSINRLAAEIGRSLPKPSTGKSKKTREQRRPWKATKAKGKKRND